MPTKQELTHSVIDLLGDRCSYDFESAMLSWWQDNRTNGGMRLTLSGHKQFDSADLEHWQFTIDHSTPASPMQLLMLKEHLQMPYFLEIGKKRSITFYGSREASMFALYGDIGRFVLALKNSS